MATGSVLHKCPEEMPRFTWLDHQQQFLQAKGKYIADIGGVRSGKSLVAAYQAIKWSQLYPGSKGLIGRLTATALIRTTMDTFFGCCPKGLVADWRAHENHLWLNTPEPGVWSEILFTHLDEPGPLGSLELDWFWIDECHEPDGQEVPEETFKILQTRLSGHCGPNRGMVTSNPGGHDWLYRWFVSKDQVPKVLHHEYQSFVAKTADNLGNLPERYSDIYTQHTMPDGHLDEWGRRFLEASFDTFEGQIYPMFNEAKHVRIPEPWRKNGKEIPFHGMDFGVRNATGIVTGFLDQQGILWVEDEFYLENGGEAVVPEVLSWCKARGIDWVVGDPSMHSRGADGKSVAQRFALEGLTVVPGNNTLLLGIEEVRHRLADVVHLKDGSTIPTLCVLPRCKNLIEQLKKYRWAPQPAGRRELEQPLKRDDHAVDALRYMVMAVSLGQRGGVDVKVENEPPNRAHPRRDLMRLRGGIYKRYDKQWG